MAEKKYFNKILPVATAQWPKLNEPDVFTPKKGKGQKKVRYKVNLKFDDENHRKVDAWLKSVAKEAGDAVGDNENSPWQKDKKTGELTLMCFAGEDRKPPLWDSKNKRIPDNVVVGGGSKIKVDVTANPYDGFGGGINIYLNAVQVIDLKEGRGAGASRFEEEEGFEHSGKTEPESRFDSHTAGDDAGTDDDIPF